MVQIVIIKVYLLEVLSEFKSKNICMLQMKKQDCLHDYGL